MTCQSKKLSTKFNVKDKTGFYHQSNLGKLEMSQLHTCTEDYIRETDPRIKQKTIDHNKRDRNSHILKHSHEKGNSQV